MKRLIRNSALLFLLVISYSFSFSQRISGVINDQFTKEPIPGVTVEIKSLNLVTQTSPSGYFEFTKVPNGNYELSASYVGYGIRTQKIEVSQNSGQKLVFNIEESTTNLNEVKVNSKINRETDINARRKEKNSNNIVNVVSAQTILRSPDLNAAEVSKRISGVSLVVSSDSKDEYLIIRGFEPRYSNTTLNGVQIPSPDDKNKTIPLNLFPSEIIGSIVISKSLTPDLALDAVAGTVDIQFKDAPSKDLLEVNFGGGFNQKVQTNGFKTFNSAPSHALDPYAQFGKNYVAKPSDFPFSVLRQSSPPSSPNLIGGFTFGKRFLKDKLGFILSVSDQDSYSINSSSAQDIIINANNQLSDGNKNTYSLNVFTNQYYFHTNSFGLSSKMDFIISERSKISLSTVYTTSHNLEALSNRVSPAIQPNGKVIGLATVDSIIRSNNRIQNLLSLSLKGVHKINSKINLDYTAVYGISNAKVPDQAYILLYETYKEPPFAINPNSTFRTWQRNYNKLYAGYINLGYKVKIFQKENNIKLGGVFSYKHRNNYRNKYTLNGILPNSSSALYFSDQINENNFEIKGTSGAANINTDNFTADEKLQQFYAMDQLKWDKLDVVFGLRDEITDQSIFTRSITPPYPAIINHKYYNDLSPEISLKFNLRSDQSFRFAYYQAISRPNLYDLTSYTDNQGVGNQTGNPNLKHARSYNFDARFETFSKGDNAILIGVFYKKILDAIETTYSTGNPIITTSLYNVSNPAISYGSEINIIQYVGNFGISGNYTYNISRIPDSKSLVVRDFDANGNYLGTSHTEFLTVFRALQQQSKNLANLSFLYRDVKTNFNINFSILFQGKRIDAAQPYYNQDYYQQDYWNFAAAADKTIGKKLIIFIKANNLTDSKTIVRTQSGVFISSTTAGQEYLLGFRYKFFNP